MPKPISRPVHGFIDYNYVAAVAAAPDLYGFKDEKNAALMCRALSGTVLLSTLCTRAEWGLVRVLPFKVHLALDVAGSVLALASPWLFGFSGNSRARNAFLAFGLFGLVAVSQSRPDEMPRRIEPPSAGLD